MESNLLEYGALGAFTTVVLLFLRAMSAERRDRRKEREVFVEIITNHVEHDREAKEELGKAITSLCECLRTRPCLAGASRGEQENRRTEKRRRSEGDSDPGQPSGVRATG